MPRARLVSFVNYSVTRAITGIGDYVSSSVAFLPLALVGVPVQDLRLFSVNLAFVTLVPAAYAALIHRGGAHGFQLWEVLTLAGLYLVYLAIMLLWVLNLV